MTTLIAQLTDTHIVEPTTDEVLYADNNGQARMAIASINACSPHIDAVVATGDLTQWGAPAEYAKLAELFAEMAAPVLPIPGNHDDRGRLRATFPTMPWVDGDHASWVVVVDRVRIIGLDTVWPGNPGAEFDVEREAWLREVLGSVHDGPTILAMHHPPFRTGIRWMDRNGFVGFDRFEAVLRECGGVDKIICGHLHRPISSAVAGIPAEVGLSTTVHVELDLNDDGPRRIICDPIGYRIHAVTGRSVVSHTRYVGTGESAFVPDWTD